MILRILVVCFLTFSCKESRDNFDSNLQCKDLFVQQTEYKKFVEEIGSIFSLRLNESNYQDTFFLDFIENSFLQTDCFHVTLEKTSNIKSTKEVGLNNFICVRNSWKDSIVKFNVILHPIKNRMFLDSIEVSSLFLCRQSFKW